MRKKKTLMLFAASLTLIFCAATSEAQTSAEVVQKLMTTHGDEYIVRINGVEYRAVNAEHARAIESRKIELDACNAQSADVRRALDLAMRNIQLSADMLATERLLSASWERSYKLERELRLRSEKLQGRGRVSSFFNHWLSQVIFKGVLPTATTLLSSRK